MAKRVLMVTDEEIDRLLVWAREYRAACDEFFGRDWDEEDDDLVARLSAARLKGN